MESVCDAGGGAVNYNSDCHLAIIIGTMELWNQGSMEQIWFMVNGEWCLTVEYLTVDLRNYGNKAEGKKK